MSSDIPSALDVLKAISGFQADPNGYTEAQDRPPLMATIDPAYTTGNPRVTFDGETTMGTRTYTWLGFPPVAGSRVVMLPVGRTYVILGALGTPAFTKDSGLAPIPLLAASGGASGQISVNFNKTFPVAPQVVGWPGTSRLTTALVPGSITTTGFKFTANNWTPGASAADNLYWIALA